jgi:hypothetical protein
MPRNHFDVLSMTVLDVCTLKVISRKRLPDPDGLVTSTCRKQRPTWCKHSTLHLVLVALKDCCLHAKQELSVDDIRDSKSPVLKDDERCSVELAVHTCCHEDPDFRQIAVVPSKLADTKEAPPGDHETRRMVLVCASGSVVVHTGSWPSCNEQSQMRILRSPPQLATILPEAQFKDISASFALINACYGDMSASRPQNRTYTHIGKQRNAPSGDHATHQTLPVCPLRVLSVSN